MVHVKVFVSSLITGYEGQRAAAVEAIETLGHQVVRAEDFSASPATPQQACLGAVRQSDLVVLLVGERYGYVQPSGLSPTHEEYREARDSKPVLVFVETQVSREAAQQEFLNEVQAWSTGHFRAAFSTPAELKTQVLQTIHNYEIATVSASADETEMLSRANALIISAASRAVVSVPRLVFAVAGGPYRQILRPTELEKPDLAREVQQAAQFGQYSVFSAAAATQTAIRGQVLSLEQPVASVSLDEVGSICITQPAQNEAGLRRLAVPAIIEEDLAVALAHAVQFCGWLMDHVDPLHRLTDVVPIAHLTGASFMAWRTRAEHAANPDQVEVRATTEDVTVTLAPARRHRQALTHDAPNITEDLIALLRRKVRA